MCFAASLILLLLQLSGYRTHESDPDCTLREVDIYYYLDFWLSVYSCGVSIDPTTTTVVLARTTLTHTSGLELIIDALVLSAADTYVLY